MLTVISLDEARNVVKASFASLQAGVERVPYDQVVGRILAEDISAKEGVPSFDRSTVDGFAVCAADTFGCSDALPALLSLAGEVEMGEEVAVECAPGSCVRIPTGGKVPKGADAVVMLEYCEEYGDGTIGVSSAVAPGDSIVFENDDIVPGEVIVRAGTMLEPHHVGTMASLGVESCMVQMRPTIAIISTGDEIVEVSKTPVASQMRDVNTPLLAAAVEACGARAIRYPIVPDELGALQEAVHGALNSCDMVIVSGGSSAGQKDNTARVLSSAGTMLFHGVAIKPGKPTMCAEVNGVPAFGLPGHPVAAYFMFLELVRPLLVPARKPASTQAVLAQGVPSNHGRTELVPVRLVAQKGDARATGEGVRAIPVRSKSGLISRLCEADGYIEVERDIEGMAAGSLVRVSLFA